MCPNTLYEKLSVVCLKSRTGSVCSSVFVAENVDLWKDYRDVIWKHQQTPSEKIFITFLLGVPSVWQEEFVLEISVLSVHIQPKIEASHFLIDKLVQRVTVYVLCIMIRCIASDFKLAYGMLPVLL